MRIPPLLLSSFMMMVIASCSNTSQTNNDLESPEQKPVPQEVMSAGSEVLNIPVDQLGSDKDLVCLMPVSLGISDTLTYNGKLYGFCASQCREAFAQNPDAYLNN